jgi:hypothetical protein
VRAFQAAPSPLVIASGTVDVTVANGQGLNPAVTLDWQVGGTFVTYNLTQGASAPACKGRGLSAALNLVDRSTQAPVYAANVALPGCAVPVPLFAPPASNSYQVTVEVTGQGHTWRQVMDAPSSVVTLSAGTFGSPQSPAFIPMVQVN